MVIYLSPSRPDSFYIYDCEGSLSAAKAYVREKLRVVEPTISTDTEARTEGALKIWQETKPAEGTLVERYLQGRGITLNPIPATIRFHPWLKHGPSGGEWPAMVALVTNVNDVPRGIHRTYLSPYDAGKAPCDPERMSFGSLQGNAVRFGPVSDSLVVGEGIETVLSVMMATGRPAWSALSCAGLRRLLLPAMVREITILVDGDDEGERASRAAATRWQREGRRVLLAHAPPGKDFNDVLMMREGQP